MILRKLKYAKPSRKVVSAESQHVNGCDLFAAALEALPTAIGIVAATDGQFLYRNRRAIELTGVNCTGFHLAMRAAQIKILNPEGAPYSSEDMPVSRSLRLGEVVRNQEVIVERADGVRLPLLISCAPLRNGAGEITAATVIFDDISERKQAELYRKQLLRATEEQRARLQAIINALPMGLWAAEADGRITFINDIAGEIWGGYAPYAQTVGGYSLYKAWLGETGEPVTADNMPLARSLRGEVCKDLVLDVERFDGKHGTQLVSSAPIRMSDGTIAGSVVITQDITERRRLEREIAERTEQLRRSERHFRTLVENIPLVIARFDRDLRYLYRSQHQLDKHCNINADRFVGKTWKDLGIPETVYRPWQIKLHEAIRTGRTVEYEIDFPDKDGTMRHYLACVVPEIDDTGQVESLLGFSVDITERKQLETELLRLDRLNTVGEMAAAIGHEVRNPLTTVRGYLQMFLRKAESAKYHEQFATMIEELDRANIIISDFLSLAKNRAIELKTYNLNDVISSLLPLLQAEALRTGHDFAIETGDIPDFLMDEKEIRQLLLNLARNAFEAMEPGGKLTIITSPGNGRVMLSVHDTGPGIPQKVLDNLGTPFLTTKEKGTGLGLAVCYRIAEHHNAKIIVKTSPQGTAFHICFRTLIS